MNHIANDRLAISAMIGRAISTGDHHSVLSRLQKAMDTLKQAYAKDPNSVYKERIDALEQAMSDASAALGKKTEHALQVVIVEGGNVQPFTPKTRIARIKSYFLEDDAISLNGRQYPREAVDRLIQSAQLQLSDPQALPLTCYLSHDKADQDSTRDITGKITHVGREGSRAYVMIDIHDTTAGRDAATLIAGGYIRSQSLRASGAQMRMEHDRTFPQVSGTGLKLEGIDFTTRPGLPQVARIAELVTESAEPQSLCEVFNAHPTSLLLEGEPMKTQEEYIKPEVRGDSPSVDGSPRGDYPYPAPAVQMAGNADIDREIHDHIAAALDMSCAPSTMERARSRQFLTGLGLMEAGAKFSAKTKNHLMAAHDGVARKLGMECADGSDGMQDGDDDDMPAQQKEAKKMTPEEAARILKEAGYSVAPPKTQEQLLQEKLDAMQAAFDQKLAEMQKALTPQSARYTPAPAQRRSLVEGANVTEAPKRTYYRHGDYLKEQLRGVDPRELIDRSRPLPEWMDPERALAEYKKVLLGMYDAQYPLD